VLKLPATWWLPAHLLLRLLPRHWLLELHAKAEKISNSAGNHARRQAGN
jgi:hypothetical protein